MPIPDLIIDSVDEATTGSKEVYRLLQFDDHLLRRFGQLDLIRKSAEPIGELTCRSVADELWFVLEGPVQILARDLRTGSPSQGEEINRQLPNLSRLLIPFGVGFGWRSVGESALMLRCATHQDGDHPQDRRLPLEEPV